MQHTLIIHRVSTDEKRTETLDGRKYWVIPMVSIKEGVLNGQLAPAEEIGKFEEAWNDIPIPVNHPQRNGQYISARHLDVLENEVIGRHYNAKFEDNKLKGEVWVDIEKAKALAQNNEDIAAALEKLENGEAMDVSTGYFCEVENKQGMFNNQKYNGIQRNIRPDHIALLPNDKGACSWESGCGIPRVNHLQIEGGEQVDDNVKFSEKVKKTLMELFGLNKEMGYNEKREAIEKALAQANGPEEYRWVIDVFDNYFIYEEKEVYYKQSYAIDENGEAVLLNDPVEVVREVTYKPIANKEGEEELSDKKELKTKIMAYECNPFTAEKLDEMEVNQLEKIDNMLATNCKEPETDSDVTANKKEGEDLSEIKELATNMKELMEKFKDIDVNVLKEAAEMVKTNKEKEKKARKDLIETLSANGQFDKEELEKLETSMLEKLVSVNKPVNFAGRGLPKVNDDNDEEYKRPSILNKKDGDK